jgi:hypothetical protein
LDTIAIHPPGPLITGLLLLIFPETLVVPDL